MRYIIQQDGNATVIRRVAVPGRLASLGIMGTRFRRILKPLRPSQHYRIEEFKEDPLLIPHYVERRHGVLQTVDVIFSSLSITQLIISVRFVKALNFTNLENFGDSWGENNASSKVDHVNQCCLK